MKILCFPEDIPLLTCMNTEKLWDEIGILWRYNGRYGQDMNGILSTTLWCHQMWPAGPAGNSWDLVFQTSGKIIELKRPFSSKPSMMKFSRVQLTRGFSSP